MSTNQGTYSVATSGPLPQRIPARRRRAEEIGDAFPRVDRADGGSGCHPDDLDGRLAVICVACGFENEVRFALLQPVRQKARTNMSGLPVAYAGGGASSGGRTANSRGAVGYGAPR